MLSIILKSFVAFVVLVAAIFIAGVSGLSFHFWPTTISDSGIEITPKMNAQLQELKAERKFLPDKAHFYPGAPNEIIRSNAQTDVDNVIGTLIAELPRKPKRSFVLGEFKAKLPAFDKYDSEEKDEALVYLERVMSIVGIANSGELLNVWRYGFPYGWFNKS